MPGGGAGVGAPGGGAEACDESMVFLFHDGTTRKTYGGELLSEQNLTRLEPNAQAFK